MKRLTALIFFALLTGCGSYNSGPGAPPQETDVDQRVVFFQEGSTSLTPEGRGIIRDVVTRYNDTHARGMTIVGEADGATPHDVDLAAKRARAVVDALTASGVDASRIEVRAGPAPTGEKGVAAHKVIVRLHQS
jgi:outer membrane protein OmpA-like peptidoglycan-associated protein